MKIIICFVFQLATINLFSQDSTQKLSSDTGKLEFIKQSRLDTPHYYLAEKILKQQIVSDPQNAELHYYYGYTLDRINNQDAQDIPKTLPGLSFLVSEQFEIVNKLEPQFKHDLFLLDPYTKLSAIWGSLAEFYLLKGKPDSAKWAFQEGKIRGGFLEPVLEFHRQMLASCETNSVLLTSGDIITFSIWYLQQIERLRPDITIVDLNLLNSKWYGKYLAHSTKLRFGLSEQTMDTLEYLKWQPATIKIQHPDDATKILTWELRPTYQDSFILKGNILLLDLLKQNFFGRPFYFANYSDSSTNLFLSSHLVDHGLVSSVSASAIDNEKDTMFINPVLGKYYLNKATVNSITKSKDAIAILNYYRWAYHSNIVHLLQIGKRDLALKLVDEMELKFPESELPYSTQEEMTYFKGLRKSISNNR